MKYFTYHSTIKGAASGFARPVFAAQFAWRMDMAEFGSGKGAPEASPVKVLVIEDDPMFRRAIAETLRRQGMTVFEAAHREEAEDLVRRERPQVAIVDVMLGGRRAGLEFCRVVREDPELAETYLILATGLGGAEDFERGRTEGADQYIVKPFRPSMLVDMLGRLGTLIGPRAR